MSSCLIKTVYSLDFLNIFCFLMNFDICIYIAGFLGGSEDYYTHVFENAFDLYDNEQPDFKETGTYSAHLFATKAGEIVIQHAANQPDKVGSARGSSSDVIISLLQSNRRDLSCHR